MMRPCVGIVGLCPPLCKLEELRDGTYTLADVMMFNIAMDELEVARDKAIAAARNT